MTRPDTAEAEPADSGPLLPLPPIVGALIGAAVGALAWGLIAKFTGYEVGFVAWGIGIVVGVGATACGGRGRNLAILCAAIAVFAIFGGKLFAAHLVLSESSAADAMRGSLISPERYEEYLEDARLVQGLETDTDLKGYMIEREYADGPTVQNVSDQDLAEFRADTLPNLNERFANPPSYEQWSEDQQAFIDIFSAAFDETEGTPIEHVQENLTAIDLVFIGLGLVSAFKLVDARGEPPRERPARRSAAGAAARRRRRSAGDDAGGEGHG